MAGELEYPIPEHSFLSALHIRLRVISAVTKMKTLFWLGDQRDPLPVPLWLEKEDSHNITEGEIVVLRSVVHSQQNWTQGLPT